MFVSKRPKCYWNWSKKMILELRAGQKWGAFVLSYRRQFVYKRDIWRTIQKLTTPLLTRAFIRHSIHTAPLVARVLVASQIRTSPSYLFSDLGSRIILSRPVWYNWKKRKSSKVAGSWQFTRISRKRHFFCHLSEGTGTIHFFFLFQFCSRSVGIRIKAGLPDVLPVNYRSAASTPVTGLKHVVKHWSNFDQRWKVVQNCKNRRFCISKSLFVYVFLLEQRLTVKDPTTYSRCI
jgi:hypothetical protein